MLTTDKILAHKTHGKNLILLTQVESSYFLVVAHVITSKSLFTRKASKGILRTIFQKQLSEAEASVVFTELTGTQPTQNGQGGTNSASDSASKTLLLSAESVISNSKKNSAQEITLLLEGTIQATETSTEEKSPQPIVSPYFPTKEIFLSVQKTRAPAIA